jgi:hypothetical protein
MLMNERFGARDLLKKDHNAQFVRGRIQYVLID